MIQLKDLISENILYSCSWEYKNSKHYVYLTKDKLYEYTYSINDKSYSYALYLIRDFGEIIARPLSYRPPNYTDIAAYGFITICNRLQSGRALASFDFPCSEEGAKIAENLFVAISKVMN